MNYEYPNREKNSHDFRFLRKIGYVDFIERMADSQLALGLQNPVARRLTAIAFIMGAVGIGVVSGLLVHASDQGLSLFGYFALLPVAVFFAWLAEVAMAIQVGRAIFKHFDERMEHIYLEAKAQAHGLSMLLMAVALFFSPVIFLTIRPLDLAFSIYIAFALPMWTVVATAPHIILSWTLGARVDDYPEDDA